MDRSRRHRPLWRHRPAFNRVELGRRRRGRRRRRRRLAPTRSKSKRSRVRRRRSSRVRRGYREQALTLRPRVIHRCNHTSFAPARRVPTFSLFHHSSETNLECAARGVGRAVADAVARSWTTRATRGPCSRGHTVGNARAATTCATTMNPPPPTRASVETRHARAEEASRRRAGAIDERMNAASSRRARPRRARSR